MNQESTNYYTRHALSAIMPDLSEIEYNDLKQDIQKNGINNKEIIIYQNEILDGWHRYKIACELNLLDTIDLVHISPSINPVVYVYSQNLHRRHLTEGQRSQIAVEAHKWLQHGNIKAQTFDGHMCPSKSNTEMAKIASVSTTTIKKAKEVSKAGRSDEVISGEKSQNQIIKEERQKREQAEREKEQAQNELDTIKNKKPNKHLGFTTGEYEWYTPKEYIDAVRAVLGEIDLDPATSEFANQTVQSKKIYTVETNGLDKTWEGKVFMNPPFKNELIKQFVPKLIKHYKNNEISEAILLTDSCTETSWYQDALDTSTAYCHPKSRLKFYDPNNKIQSAHRPQTFFYFGNNPINFCEIFKEKGYTINKSQDSPKDDNLFGYYNSFFDPFPSMITQLNSEAQPFLSIPSQINGLREPRPSFEIKSIFLSFYR